ncbi:hypothetical protein HA402_000614 [Bradysia odoriphaga]|nr:hypothetical protein HA402_000614 [Bradysia odoriphaga]
MIPEFKGDVQSLPVFLKRCETFNAILSEEGKKQFLAHLIFKLNGKAFSIFESKKFTDWNELKKALTIGIKVPKSTSALQNELMTMAQQENQSSKEFADEIKEKLRELSELLITQYDNDDVIASFKSEHEKIAVRTFKEGLRPPLKFRVMNFETKSLDEMVKKAVEEEPFVKVLKTSFDSSSAMTGNSRELQNGSGGVMKKFQNDMRPTIFRNRTNWRPRHNWNRRGHAIDTCYARLSEGEQQQLLDDKHDLLRKMKQVSFLETPRSRRSIDGKPTPQWHKKEQKIHTLCAVATEQQNMTRKETKFTFRALNDTTGLYFEKIAPIRLYNNEWHIVYHMNLSALQDEFNVIKETVDKLGNLCKEIHDQLDVPDNFTIQQTNTRLESHTFTRQCGAPLEQIHASMTQINDFNTHWFYTKNREKRAPFNIIGSLLRSLFGTLSQEDAEDYLRRFNNMESSLIDRLVVAEEHTTFLQSTVDILQAINAENMEIHQKTDKQFKALKLTVEQLINNFEFESYWLNLELKSQIDDLMTFVSLSLNLYHTKQRQFLEAITFGSTTVAATPIILPPSSFLDELIYIQQQISGNSLTLPLPTTKDFIANYYQLASTRSRIIDDQLLVSMSIPLIDLKQYQLIKVTSLPNKLPTGLYQFIIPEHEYIAIDDFHETYVTLTNKELENCHDLRGQTEEFAILCMQNSPIFHITPTRDDCSITLLTTSNTTKHCDTRVSDIKSEIYIKLRQPNSWIGVFPQSQTLYVRCSNSPTFEEQVSGIGIISIKQDCQIKTNQIVITAQNSYFSEIYQQITPSVTFDQTFEETSIVLPQWRFVQEIDAPNVVSLGESEKLKRLSTSISQLRDKLNRRPFLEWNQPSPNPLRLWLDLSDQQQLHYTNLSYLDNKRHQAAKIEQTLLSQSIVIGIQQPYTDNVVVAAINDQQCITPVSTLLAYKLSNLQYANL